MNRLGNAPIPVPFWILAKVSFLVCLVFPFLSYFGILPMLYENTIMKAAGVGLFLVGSIIFFPALFNLGNALVVGLPEEKTELKTKGVYKISRNPIYFGGFIMCAGSCLFAFHIATILAFLAAVFIHHFIVLKEEKFLEKRFGEEWLAYTRTVRRYF